MAGDNLLEDSDAASTAPPKGRPSRRANDLDGRQWTRNSISVWNDISKSAEEKRLSKSHPAMFPEQLVRRVIESFMAPTMNVVLDPFAGTGSTVVAAQRMGKHGIGFEVYDEYAEVGRDRLRQSSLLAPDGRGEIHTQNAQSMLGVLPRDSVDLVFTSPPYWDVLTRKRSADYRDSRHYGDHEHDLGNIADYEAFLDGLAQIFKVVLQVMRPGAYCVVNVMDLRKKSAFYAFHSDLAEHLVSIGFVWDDLIIWDRRADYSNLRPLGYPSVFRINKVHEYLVIMQKPS